MKLTLVGSRYFGATELQALLGDGVDVIRVVAPAIDDRLALAATKAGIALHVLANPRLVPGEAIAEGTDLIVADYNNNATVVTVWCWTWPIFQICTRGLRRSPCTCRWNGGCFIWACSMSIRFPLAGIWDWWNTRSGEKP